MFATAFENNSLDSLKDLAEDALTSTTDFTYVIKGEDSEEEEED